MGFHSALQAMQFTHRDWGCQKRLIRISLGWTAGAALVCLGFETSVSLVEAVSGSVRWGRPAGSWFNGKLVMPRPMAGNRVAETALAEACDLLV